MLRGAAEGRGRRRPWIKEGWRARLRQCTMETGCPRVGGRVFDGKLKDALRNVVWSFLRIPEELVIAMGGGRPQVSMQFPAGLGRRRPGEEGQLGWHSGYLPSGVHRPWLPPLRGPQPRERRERHGEDIENEGITVKTLL